MSEHKSQQAQAGHTLLNLKAQPKSNMAITPNLIKELHHFVTSHSNMILRGDALQFQTLPSRI